VRLFVIVRFIARHEGRHGQVFCTASHANNKLKLFVLMGQTQDVFVARTRDFFVVVSGCLQNLDTTIL
jgi:hypothetical protein